MLIVSQYAVRRHIFFVIKKTSNNPRMILEAEFGSDGTSGVNTVGVGGWGYGGGVMEQCRRCYPENNNCMESRVYVFFLPMPPT